MSSTRSSCARYFPPTTTIVSSVGSVKLTNGLKGIRDEREIEDIYLRLGLFFLSFFPFFFFLMIFFPLFLSVRLNEEGKIN